MKTINPFHKIIVMSCFFLITISLISRKPVGNQTLSDTDTGKNQTWQINVDEAIIINKLTGEKVVSGYNGDQQQFLSEQKPSPGNVYLILKIKVKKKATNPSTFSWKNLSIQDENGNSFARHPNDQFLENFKYVPRLTGLDLKFGENSGWVCYEIPEGIKNQNLRLVYNSGEDSQILFLNI